MYWSNLEETQEGLSILTRLGPFEWHSFLLGVGQDPLGTHSKIR